jgi:type I restriction enzyme R subunit
MTPERKARVEMDALLAAAGTHVCDMAQANGHPAIGLAIRELPLSSGAGFVDYLFHVNGCSWSRIEVRKQGALLAGVEPRSGLYPLPAKSSPRSIPLSGTHSRCGRLLLRIPL